VADGHRSRGVGLALKLHQRSWALSRGIELITWTFDPLVRRNAYFNVTKLGADLKEYRVAFYGSMPDAINGGDDSDRAVAAWQLSSPRAVMAGAGRGIETDIDALRHSGAKPVLHADSRGRPAISDQWGTQLLCQVPQDIVTLRRTDPSTAVAWRLALRKVMGEALSRRYRVATVSRSGWYVLAQDGPFTTGTGGTLA
jgi:predicted GNAT superfamily acetyltransferase